jgi:hypothetical protein
MRVEEVFKGGCFSYAEFGPVDFEGHFLYLEKGTQASLKKNQVELPGIDFA